MVLGTLTSTRDTGTLSHCSPYSNDLPKREAVLRTRSSKVSFLLNSNAIPPKTMDEEVLGEQLVGGKRYFVIQKKFVTGVTVKIYLIAVTLQKQYILPYYILTVLTIRIVIIAAKL